MQELNLFSEGVIMNKKLITRVLISITVATIFVAKPVLAEEWVGQQSGMYKDKVWHFTKVKRGGGHHRGENHRRGEHRRNGEHHRRGEHNNNWFFVEDGLYQWRRHTDFYRHHSGLRHRFVFRLSL